MFKIGAAWNWVLRISHLDFIIPGVEVSDNSSGENASGQNFWPQTGSSVATALGVGLAALVICCVQLATIHTQISRQKGQVDVSSFTLDDLRNVKNHENMQDALKAIGTSPDSNHKFIEVWKMFDNVTKSMAGKDKEERLEVIAKLASRFKKAY